MSSAAAGRKLMPLARRGASAGWRCYLCVEMGVLFFAGPAVYALLDPGPGWLFPVIWALGAVGLVILLSDRTFDRGAFWAPARAVRESRRITATFGVLALAAAVVIWAVDSWWVQKDILFGLPRRRPGLWLTIMALYPIFSVFPQEIAFRTFFFHRYAAILPSKWAMIAVSAVAFSWAHIVFQNVLSLAACLAGGVLFGITYWRSRSTLAAWFEHGLWGCFVFTIGIGEFFYAGRVG